MPRARALGGGGLEPRPARREPIELALHLAERVGGVADPAAGLHLVEVDPVQQDSALDVRRPGIDAVEPAVGLRGGERDLGERQRPVRLVEVGGRGGEALSGVRLGAGAEVALGGLLAVVGERARRGGEREHEREPDRKRGGHRTDGPGPHGAPPAASGAASLQLAASRDVHWR